MKKTLLLPSLLTFFFLASCSKENVDPKVESITPTSDLYEEGKVTGARIDAGYGAYQDVILPTNIPPGWVIVSANGNRGTIRKIN